MNWRIINKATTPQPTIGKYSDWKYNLAIEGYNQCVYCSIKDAQLGGFYNFHVEHYKPKSLFPHLKNTITNLFYSCPICNIFKSNDWHEVTGDLNNIYYPDPSNFDYSNLFSVEPNGYLISKNNCGTYIINKLGLNRTQLVIDRNFINMIKSYKELMVDVRKVRDQLIIENSENSIKILKDLVAACDRVLDKKDKLDDSSPYEAGDTKK